MSALEFSYSAVIGMEWNGMEKVKGKGMHAYVFMRGLMTDAFQEWHLHPII